MLSKATSKQTALVIQPATVNVNNFATLLAVFFELMGFHHVGTEY